MTSFDFEARPKDVSAAKFISETQRELVRQLLLAKDKDPTVSQSAVARLIDTDKATLTRILSGKGNITLRKLAEIAWALGLDPKVVYEPIDNARKNHDQVVQSHRRSATLSWSGSAAREEIVRSVVEPHVHAG